MSEKFQSTREKSLKKNFFKKKTEIESFFYNIKYSIFNVLYIITKEKIEFSFFVEVCFLGVDLANWSSFPFDPNVINIYL